MQKVKPKIGLEEDVFDVAGLVEKLEALGEAFDLTSVGAAWELYRRLTTCL